MKVFPKEPEFGKHFVTFTKRKRNLRVIGESGTRRRFCAQGQTPAARGPLATGGTGSEGLQARPAAALTDHQGAAQPQLLPPFAGGQVGADR